MFNILQEYNNASTWARNFCIIHILDFNDFKNVLENQMDCTTSIKRITIMFTHHHNAIAIGSQSTYIYSYIYLNRPYEEIKPLRHSRICHMGLRRLLFIYPLSRPRLNNNTFRRDNKKIYSKKTKFMWSAFTQKKKKTTNVSCLPIC